MNIFRYVLVLSLINCVPLYSMGHTQSWQQIQADAQNAVVQVFVVSRSFNWFNPYVVHGTKQVCGTGFFINEEGEIATCSHVIENALAVFIGIPCLGKCLLKAHVVGLCPSRDIAILRLDDESFDCVCQELGKIHYLELGDSDVVQRGEEIICLGYPATTIEIEQLKGTTGVISSRLNRLFQYDAPSNPGNSGGPVLNKKGIVIGITTSGMTGNIQNTNFAIPINIFKILSPDLYEHRLLKINELGIIWSSTTKEIRAYLGSSNHEGCVVCDFEKTALTSSINLEIGDILYEVDGYVIDSYGDIKALCDGERIRFDEYVSQLPLGSEVNFKLYRNGESLDLSVIINNGKESSIPLKYPMYEKIEYEVFGGMIVMPLTINYIEACAKERPGLQRYLTNMYTQGARLVISNIIADSKMAHMHTLSWADTINEINGEKVCTLNDFRSALKKSIETGIVVIKTTREATLETDNDLNVLSLYDSCKETVQLSHVHQYPLSETIVQIIQQVDPSLLKR